MFLYIDFGIINRVFIFYYTISIIGEENIYITTPPLQYTRDELWSLYRLLTFLATTRFEPLDTVNYGFIVQKTPFFLIYPFFQVDEKEILLTFQIDRIIIELILDSTLNG